MCCSLADCHASPCTLPKVTLTLSVTVHTLDASRASSQSKNATDDATAPDVRCSLGSDAVVNSLDSELYAVTFHTGGGFLSKKREQLHVPISLWCSGDTLWRHTKQKETRDHQNPSFPQVCVAYMHVRSVDVIHAAK